MIRPSALLLVFATALAACSSDPAGPIPPSVLDGLQQSVAHDSVGGTPPTPQNPTGSGEIHGTVLLPSNGGGGDTLATAPRVVGATITAYPVLNSSSLELGPAAASTVTGADGMFTLPTLAAGEYVITVEPPAALASTHYGTWIRGNIHPDSGYFPWWVVLAAR